jgi:anti-anti-sigma factor
MKVLRTEAEGTIVVAVHGMFERGRATVELFNELKDELDKGPHKLIMDLDGMKVVDSMALGLLVGLYLKCRELEVGFTLAGVSRELKALLDTTSITQIIPQSSIAEDS